MSVYCASYELLFAYELRVNIIARVTSYFLHTKYEFLFSARVTSYFLYESYKLLIIERVTSYFLTMSYDKDSDDIDVMIMIL